MRRSLMVLAAGALLALSACSVVDDGKVGRIDPPGGLDDTLPATTSTTSTIPETTTTGINTATTVVQTEPVRLYFIASGQLVYVTVPIPSPVALPVIISALQEGPPTEAFGLRTALPPESVAQIRVNTDGTGVATVDLPDDFFDPEKVSFNDQRLVIAQIVLTLTSSRGIGQVIFDLPVTKPLGEFVPAGEPLSYRDYEALASSSPLPTDAADTSSPTSSTA